MILIHRRVLTKSFLAISFISVTGCGPLILPAPNSIEHIAPDTYKLVCHDDHFYFLYNTKHQPVQCDMQGAIMEKCRNGYTKVTDEFTYHSGATTEVMVVRCSP